jgi:hypothetical protein
VAFDKNWGTFPRGLNGLDFLRGVDVPIEERGMSAPQFPLERPEVSRLVGGEQRLSAMLAAGWLAPFPDGRFEPERVSMALYRLATGHKL